MPSVSVAAATSPNVAGKATCRARRSWHAATAASEAGAATVLAPHGLAHDLRARVPGAGAADTLIAMISTATWRARR